MISAEPRIDPAKLVLHESCETLLATGGDGRVDLHEGTGLNQYGCAPRVREVVPFGSCTASSASKVSVNAAGEALSLLKRAARKGGVDAVNAQASLLLEQTRSELVRQLELDPESVQVAFCPSGTDAEYLALALARAGSKQPIVNIVAGPSEVGSGTTKAANGHHFQTTVPAGGSRVPGESVDRQLSDDVQVRTIVLRDGEGEMHAAASLDAEAERLIEEAIGNGARVLLHIVAHSKTGAHAPRLAKVRALRERFGDQLSVIVDAAQGRISRRGLRQALAEGFMVLFTGSKFYGGPSFSGALFVPEKLWPENTGLSSLPRGLSDYLTQPELPAEWATLGASLPTAPNLGLVLRWRSAIAEIVAYYSILPQRRLEILRTWELCVPELFSDSPTAIVMPVRPVQGPESLRLLESKVTVFPFLLKHAGGDFLDVAELKRVYKWLNRDISQLLPEANEDERAALACRIHVGQPVLLSGNATQERAVLRVALGGSLVTRVAGDDDLCASYEERLNWFRQQVVTLRAKLELIVAHMNVLVDRDASIQ